MKKYALGFIHASALAWSWFILPPLITKETDKYILAGIASILTVVGWVLYLIIEVEE